ncbi:hypothetical protein BJ138DRAFT_1147459 [Hygrophoropsis aurantiaca]|uniref:Uncharacterized protein n=1 Tax=Hygrophoropsis aurantiaca TaxID=72124 RepID=A0ACB8AI32_9AGAM|nr:hypothetical protein BJ138DRAFT_1147459 [Hygrophoropsis aurantiaca]
MEEGEIESPSTNNASRDYDPAFEWPGDDDLDNVTANQSTSDNLRSQFPWPLLRLIIIRSSILSKKRNRVVLDAYSEAQFGRDVAPAGIETPRVRLKEMEVSKLHATVFWDKERREWSIVDMGSMHGTFLKRCGGSECSSVEGSNQKEGIRLAPSRTASVPRPLRHLDLLTIGNTTFMCHIHHDSRPCSECASDGEGDIPLFNDKRGDSRSIKRLRDNDTELNQPRDSKKALTMLKRNLLMRHQEDRPKLPPSKLSTSPNYIDRSARRRALHPASAVDSPGIPSSRTDAVVMPSPHHEETPHPPSPLEKSQSPAPLADNNLGRRLLLKQGWQPGTSLGCVDDDSGLVEPLEVSSTAARAGLGMQISTPPSSFGNWKEAGRQRRWDNT